jgi:hypothetical protein
VIVAEVAGTGLVAFTSLAFGSEEAREGVIVTGAADAAGVAETDCVASAVTAGVEAVD